MLPPAVHRAKLDRTVRLLWLAFAWIAAILAAGASVEAFGLG
jgi:hypothetical protein